MSLVKAAVELDNNSTYWSATMTFAQAEQFCNTRDVVYSYKLADVVAALADIMQDTYCIFTMGREYARCIHLEWDASTMSLDSFDILRSLSSEFDNIVNGSWAKLRMCWC